VLERHTDPERIPAPDIKSPGLAPGAFFELRSFA
jgi:hypothetical protein